MSFAIFSKFILNGIIAGSLYALLALGLSLLYGILRFVNMAHGEIAVAGAFAFYGFSVLLGWPLVPSFLASISVIFALAFCIERFTFRPVREAPSLIPLIISIGVSIIIKNALLLFFDAYARSMNHSTQSFVLFSDIVRITDVQLVILATSTLLMIGLFYFLKLTKWGRAIRAVSDNKEVAAILGIPINRIITLTFLISAFLAATAGILAAYDQNLHPNLGTFFTIKSFAAVILGGIGSIPGAVLGGYFIGLAENILIGLPLGALTIPSNYKDAIALAALILFLYFKPTGFFGAKQEESVRK